jgi:hypothetical protein
MSNRWRMMRPADGSNSRSQPGRSLPVRPCPQEGAAPDARSGRDFPDLMVHMMEGVRPGHNGAPTLSERIDGRFGE